MLFMILFVEETELLSISKSYTAGKGVSESNIKAFLKEVDYSVTIDTAIGQNSTFSIGIPNCSTYINKF